MDVVAYFIDEMCRRERAALPVRLLGPVMVMTGNLKDQSKLVKNW